MHKKCESSRRIPLLAIGGLGDSGLARESVGWLGSAGVASLGLLATVVTRLSRAAETFGDRRFCSAEGGFLEAVGWQV